MPTTSARLLALLSLLQARRDWPAADLAARLDVTDRTVRRDVDRLRGLGYPITSTRGRDGGYRLDAGTDLPPLLLDDEQAVALVVALRAAAVSGVDVAEPAERALRTVQQVLPARLRHRVDAVPATTVGTATGPLVDPRVLTAVGAAVRAREVLRFDYPARAGTDGGAVLRDGYGERVVADDGPPRRAEPHHLVVRAGRWYLVAWDLDRDDWRVFRVDRIRPRTPGGARFGPRALPGGDVGAFLAARFRGLDPAQEPGGWPCVGSAVLPVAARDVAAFVGDGSVEDLDGRGARVTLGSWSWTGLAAAFARFDTDMTEVRPAALASAFRALGARALRAADSPG